MLEAKTVAVKGGPSMQVLVGGAGEALVWLHGISGVVPGETLLEILATHFRVYAPITPGRADLGELDGIDDIHDLALHYDSLLEALGLNRVILVGHSFGGMLAAEIAAHVPKRVAKLALIAPLGLWKDDEPVADLFGLPYPAMDELMWRGATTEAKPSAAIAALNDPTERQIAIVNGAASVAKFIWGVPDRGLRKRLSRINAPTLVVFGEQDAYVPSSYADEFVAKILGAQKLLMKGSHMLPFEQPDRLAEAIGSLASR